MRPAIVAHRGDAEHHPENTLPALAAAWRRLEFAEFDVQLSADGVPFVIHDTGLERTTRGAGDIRLMMSGQLDGVDAGEPARFGARHAGTPLPRLSAVAGLMAEFPGARAFVEVKRASLVHHGRAHCIERVLAALEPVRTGCFVSSGASSLGSSVGEMTGTSGAEAGFGAGATADGIVSACVDAAVDAALWPVSLLRRVAR